MSLVIVGTGMVSPAGLTPRMNACILWAGALPQTASPFVGPEGDPVQVTYCPWLGARLGMGERMCAMARTVHDDALRPVRAAGLRKAMPLIFCSAAHHPGLDANEDAKLTSGLVEATGARDVRRCYGAAGFFTALTIAEELLSSGAPAVAVVAVDSYVGVDPLAELVQSPPSPWGSAPPPPAEGAAALVLTTPSEARRRGLAALGVVHSVGTAVGQSNDENDVLVDGDAMTNLLRKLPRLRAPAPWAFGPFSVDALRQTEWQLAVARNPDLLHPEYEMRSIETELGAVGAAAGAMNLVYGLAVARHRTTEASAEEADPFLVWAISSDGTRGLAAVSVEP